ncbi:MAG: DUF4158 domain-containing protein [Nitrososphaerales archaeon]
MARRRLLGDDLWARHLEPPADERAIARQFALSRDDLELIATKRTDATRLGYALLLLYGSEGPGVRKRTVGALLVGQNSSCDCSDGTVCPAMTDPAGFIAGNQGRQVGLPVIGPAHRLSFPQ